MKEKQVEDCTVLKIYLIYNLRVYYALYENKRSIIEEIAVLEKKR